MLNIATQVRQYIEWNIALLVFGKHLTCQNAPPAATAVVTNIHHVFIKMKITTQLFP